MKDEYFQEAYAEYEMFNKLKIRRKYFADFLERNGEVTPTMQFGCRQKSVANFYEVNFRFLKLSKACN